MSWSSEGHTYTQNGNQIILDGREIGWITRVADGTRIFVSPRDRAKHYFRIFEGWGISQALFTFLLKTVEVQEIHLKVGKFLYLMSKMEDWEKHCIPYHKEPYEPQIVLPEKYFKRDQMTMAEAIG